MQSFISILGAAALVSTTACAHVQSSESATQTDPLIAADEAPRMPTTVLAPAEASPSALDTNPFPPSQETAAPEELAAAPASGQPEAPVAATGEPAKQADSAKEPAEPAQIAYEVGDVALGRVVLARAIEDREPVDAADSFEPGERVYAYVQAVNPKAEAYDLLVRWAKAEEDPGEPFPIAIGSSPRWRTWTWRNAPSQPGQYRCIIETVDGAIVAEVPFEVKS